LDDPEQAACPSCGAAGRPVADKTIRAILTPAHASSMLAVERRFCRTPSCEVVYYREDGRAIAKREVPVRVGLKECDDPVPLCYCFGFSRADVRDELASGGQCTIPARIAAEIRAGRCACEIKNPSGACCLGDVNRTVQKEQEALKAEAQPRPDLRRTGIA
jgi:hypothetical protein